MGCTSIYQEPVTFCPDQVSSLSHLYDAECNSLHWCRLPILCGGREKGHATRNCVYEDTTDVILSVISMTELKD